MNVHHLELFYYVAKYRGVSAAARHIPYGIQQPAISAQVISLEDSLGVTLFHRRPFSLTQEGRELYAYLEPFFENLSRLDSRLRGDRVVRLRIGAPETIQYNYLPAVLNGLRKTIPSISFSLVTGMQDDFERLLLAQEIDIAFTGIRGKPAQGIQFREMVRMPPALLVRERSGIRSAEQLWRMDRIDEPLLCVPRPEPITACFLAELHRRKVEWFPSLELASLDLVCRFVMEGFGTGVTLIQPDAPPPKGTRLVPLPGFPAITYGALWLGKPNALLRTLIADATAISRRLAAPGCEA